MFSESFLRKLETLTLATRSRAHGQLKGQHRSPRVGSGMVFADFRPYTEGDDIRNIDWGIYLRLDRLILRMFEEEADLPVYLFLDASQSMEAGEGVAAGRSSKLDCARHLAGALAYMALLNHDRVNLAAFAEGLREMLPTRRGKNQARQAFAFLEGIAAGGRTSLHGALRRYFSAPRTRGLVVIVSDFLDRDGVEEAFSVLRRFRHEVALLHVMAPRSASRSFRRRWCWWTRRRARPTKCRSRRRCSRPTARPSSATPATSKPIAASTAGPTRAHTPTFPVETLLLKILREGSLLR